MNPSPTESVFRNYPRGPILLALVSIQATTDLDEDEKTRENPLSLAQTQSQLQRTIVNVALSTRPYSRVTRPKKAV